MNKKYCFPMVLCVVYERLILKILSLLDALKSKVLCWLWGIECKGSVRLVGRYYFRTRKKGEIVLGDKVVFNSRFCTNLVGLINPTVLDTRLGGRIEVGNNSGGSSVIISSRSKVTIGERCKIGGNVRIFDHDFHSIDSKVRATPEDVNNIRSAAINIDDDCFIGTNAIILKGTCLGSRTIVAAGSVVFGLKVPPDSLVKGNPAVIVSREKVR
jgi:acetyltransferase-like isoleucine patch superfamily enzyme